MRINVGRMFLSAVCLTAATALAQSPIAEPELANIFIFVGQVQGAPIANYANQAEDLKSLTVAQLIGKARNNIKSQAESADSLATQQVDVVLDTYEKLSQGSLSVERANRVFADNLTELDPPMIEEIAVRYLNAGDRFAPTVYEIGDNSYLIEGGKIGKLNDFELLKVTGEVYLSIRTKGVSLTAPIGLFR